MKKYKVKALSVGALGNKIFYSGDQVSEENFIQGRAEELVVQGFLEPLNEEEEEDEKNEKKKTTKGSKG